jgi:hypothetical protein
MSMSHDGDPRPPGKQTGHAEPHDSLVEWLNKPARAVKHTAATPEDMVAWLRTQWEEVAELLGHEGTLIDAEARYGYALDDLSRGNTVCWAGWISTSVFFHLSAMPTSARCH